MTSYNDGVTDSTAVQEATQKIRLSGHDIHIDKVTLTAAQIKALRATPIEVVAAPGADKVIQYINSIAKLNYGSEVFAETADNLAFRFTDGSGAIVSEALETTGFLDQSADTQTSNLASNDAIVASASAENQALVIHNTGDGEITGNASDDSTVDIYIAYRILDLS